MLRLYSLIWWLIMPLTLLRLWWRGRREPGYRQHVLERFGFYSRQPFSTAPLIWIHAVSVGETQAAQPLLDALLNAYPKHQILLTHMTATGRAAGQALCARAPQRIQQAYLPYDTGWMMARLLRHFQPRLCVLMETEVWPNLIDQCARRQVPVVLANARLSQRSLVKGLRFAKLLRQTADKISCVAAQTEADASRLRQGGAHTVHVTGNLKFDIAPAAELIARGTQWRQQFGARQVFLCAVTRDGEEALILKARASVASGDLLLVIVPRHPQRFDEVAQLIQQSGLRFARRSQLGIAALDSQTQVLLGDSMAEMGAYYRACDVAFIGGSLLALGGHNLIEACALGKPVLLGPHMFNFAKAAADAIAAGAASEVDDAVGLWRDAIALLDDQSRLLAQGECALKFAASHRGATARTLALLRVWLD